MAYSLGQLRDCWDFFSCRARSAYSPILGLEMAITATENGHYSHRKWPLEKSRGRAWPLEVLQLGPGYLCALRVYNLKKYTKYSKFARFIREPGAGKAFP